MFRSAPRRRWICGFVLAIPAVAHASVPLAVNVYTMSSGRIVAIVGIVLALIGAINGGLALARSGRVDNSKARRGAHVALLLGPTGLAIGGFVVATGGGGVGTGHGMGGAYVAVCVGLIGLALGGLALARSRRDRRQPGTAGSSIT